MGRKIVLSEENFAQIVEATSMGTYPPDNKGAVLDMTGLTEDEQQMLNEAVAQSMCGE